MHTKRFVVFSCVVVLLSISASQGQCDAALIEAMKTNFHMRTGDTLYHSIQEQACSESQKGQMLAVPYAGYSSDELSKACNSKDEKFFRQHYKEIALSFLPPAAFETIKNVCGVRGLSLEATDEANSISVTAIWGGGYGNPSVAVSRLGWSKNIEECHGDLVPAKGRAVTLKVGVSVTADCTRKDGDANKGDSAFSLQTDRGSQRAKAYAKKHYELWVYWVDDELKCSIDDKQVLDQGLYFRGLDDNQPPIVKVDLDPMLSTRGEHVLKCQIIDTGMFEGHWCYKYKYELREDGKVILRNSPYDCNPNTPHPPTDIAPYTITTN